MSITFAESHVDLMSSITFTPQQMIRRWDQELLKKWRREVQDNLRDFMQIKASLDPETFPNFEENEYLLNAFIADKHTLYARRVADEAKNTLLIQTIAYEQALIDVAALTLQIDGREAVDAVTDPQTQEIITPAVDAIEPMSTEADGYQAAVDALAAAEAVIAGASQEVIDLAMTRT